MREYAIFGFGRALGCIMKTFFAFAVVPLVAFACPVGNACDHFWECALEIASTFVCGGEA
jgi:4-amino-4-deoxy-L-arabinose transferase-like glycosyltransferase